MEPFKFIHTADIHLGYTQYKNPERYNDFNRAFKWILDKSILEEVDFILLAGDLFNVKKTNPKIMKDVFLLLNSFKNTCEEKFGNPIPIIAIEGNHDRPVWGSEGHSWMSFLTDLELITVLSGKYDDKSKNYLFSEFSTATKRGGMIKIKDARIFGLPYLGAITSKVLPTIYNSIESSEDVFNIFLLHYGITGHDTRKAGLDLDKQVLSLHDKIDYLALGHFHKMYKLPKKEPWIFNPGSSESNSISEIITDNDRDRGVFLIKIDGKAQNNWSITEIKCENGETDDENTIPNRFFYQTQSIDIGQADLSNFNKAIDFIIEKIKNMGLSIKIEKQSLSSDSRKSDLNIPMLIIYLKGEVPYSRVEINNRLLKEKIKGTFEVLGVRIYTDSITSKLDTIEFEEKDISIDIIERTVINKMIEANKDFSQHKEGIIELLSEYKSQILGSGTNYESLASFIDNWWIKYFDPDIDNFDAPELEENQPAVKEKQKEIITDDFIDSDEDMDEKFDDGSAYLDDEEEEEEEQ